MSLVSQVKLVVLLALPTGAMIFLLFLVLLLAGFFRRPPANDVPLAFMALVLALLSGFLAGLVVIFQIVGLLLLRLLPWRGPELKVEEPRNLFGIFE